MENYLLESRQNFNPHEKVCIKCEQCDYKVMRSSLNNANTHQSWR